MPKDWFDYDRNRSLFTDLSANNVACIGEPSYSSISDEAVLSADNPVHSLYSLSKKLHPRYSMVLKGWSFVLNNRGMSNPALYSKTVHLIRWMSGLVRENIKPNRENQIFITDCPKGKDYIQAATLDFPIATYKSIQDLWDRVNQQNYSAL